MSHEWSKALVACAAVTVLLSVPVAAQAVIYVDADAPGLNDGTSWEDAYVDLQDALVAAVFGDEIRVATGLYLPDGGTGVAGFSFGLVDGVAMLGGFAGWGEPLPDARDLDMYPTILSGDLSQNDDFGVGANAENTYNVILGTGVSSSTVVDAFTIKAGNASFFTPLREGGAAWLGNSSPTFVNCTFQNNEAWGRGGAVYISPSSSPFFESCDFEMNTDLGTTGGGGAVFVDGTASFVDCTFRENESVGDNGGAIASSGPFSLTLVSCLLVGNSAFADGGALWVTNDGYNEYTNCRFIGNSVNAANSRGSAVYASGNGTLKIVQCEFLNNTGARALDQFSSVEVILSNCIVANNPAGGVGGVGGDTATNSVFWGNGTSGNEVEQVDSSIVAINCVVQGWTGFLPGVGNTWEDPLFEAVDGPDGISGTDDDNGRVIAGSSCIDAGSNVEVPADTFDLDGDGDTTEPLPLDLDQVTRFFDVVGVGDAGVGPPPVVDIGAYEYLGTEWENLGQGLEGSCGIPVLAMSGGLTGEAPVFVDLSNGAPIALAIFVIGFSEISAPFKQGTLVPSPDFLVPVPLGFAGDLSFAFPWPPGVPAGVSSYYQFWVSDAAGAAGFSSSNAMRGTTP